MLIFSSITAPLPGADFTNTFRLLSAVSCPAGEQKDRDRTDSVVELIVEQCASLEELKVANHPAINAARVRGSAPSQGLIFTLINNLMYFSPVYAYRQICSFYFIFIFRL